MSGRKSREALVRILAVMVFLMAMGGWCVWITLVPQNPLTAAVTGLLLVSWITAGMIFWLLVR